MTIKQNPDLEVHLQDHVSPSDFAEVKTDLKWIKWLLAIFVPIALGASVLDLTLRAIGK